MPMIININLLFAACEYTSVSAKRKTNPKSEIVARVFRIRSISRLSVVSFAIAKLRNHLEMVRPL